MVRVSARAVDGRAMAAALAAIAEAFAARRDVVMLVAGAARRTKVIEVAGGDLAGRRSAVATCPAKGDVVGSARWTSDLFWRPEPWWQA